MSEYGYDLPIGLFRIAIDTNGDNLVIFGSQSISVGDEDIFAHESFDHLDETVGSFRSLDIESDEGFLGAFDEGDDFGFRFFTIRFFFGYLHLDCITIEGPVTSSAPDEKNRPVGRFHESEMGLYLGVDTGMVDWFHGEIISGLYFFANS